MDNFASKLESILFVASKPLSAKKMAKILEVSEEEIIAGFETLKSKYNRENSGIVLMHNNEEWLLVSHPDNREVAEHFVKAEISGELTRPQLETLTVISYCGPITKPELEQIRGVNCSLIIRNLLMRGLIKENESGSDLIPAYEVTIDYIQHLGISSLEELPDYESLHNHEFITKALENPENKN